MIDIVRARGIHASHVQANLREIDAREWRDLGSPNKALIEKLLFAIWGTDDSYAATIDGRAIALFGCTYWKSISMAVPWLVGTNEMVKHGKQLVHFGRVYTQVWTDKYGHLENIVHAENRRAIRWLKAIGYTVSDDTLPAGARNEPYHLFSNSPCVNPQPLPSSLAQQSQ